MLSLQGKDFRLFNFRYRRGIINTKKLIENQEFKKAHVIFYW